MQGLWPSICRDCGKSSDRPRTSPLGATRISEGAYRMNSLTTGRVADVLKRLYQEAETADRPLMERYRNRDVTHDERRKLLAGEAKDYRAVYRQYRNNFLNVSAGFG